MATIKVDHELGNLTKILDQIGKEQIPFATAKALTLTAKDAERDTYQEIDRVFDRPTPIVRKGLFVKPATKRDLTAEVFVKDRPLGGKNPNSLAQLLRHQFGGGDRIVKVFERALRREGLLGQQEFIVPGDGAKLDRYGNISRGQLAQILSQLGIGAPGYDNKSTNSARSRRNVAKAGKIFWSRGPGTPPAGAYRGGRFRSFDLSTGVYQGRGTQHLPRGAWMRAGDGVKPILIVVGQPRYTRRVDMAGISQRAVQRYFSAHFQRAYREAVASAR